MGFTAKSEKKNKDYLVTQNPMKALLIFSLPMMLGDLFQQLYTLADSAIVGNFVGEKAFAACGASYAITMILICIAIGGGVGASVIVSHHFGAKKYKDMRAAVNTALVSFLVISVVLALILRFTSRPLMELVQTPKDILDMSVSYLNIYLYGLPFMFMYNVMNAMFNALGKSKIPLGFLVFSSVFNVVMDYIMVAVWDVGIEGAAWATFLAQGISAVMTFFVLMHHMRKLAGGKTVIFAKVEFAKMIKIALPSIIQQATVAIGMLLTQVVVNWFGSEALAGYTAANRIFGIAIVPMNAMGNVSSAYTAQNIGAGKIERVMKGFIEENKIIIAFEIIICIVLNVFGRQIITSLIGEADITAMALETGVAMTHFSSFFLFILGCKQALDGVLRGAGDTTVFTISNMVNLGTRVIGSFALASVIGLPVVWYMMPIGWTINWIISFCELRTGKWKRIAEKRLSGTA